MEDIRSKVVTVSDLALLAYHLCLIFIGKNSAAMVLRLGKHKSWAMRLTYKLINYAAQNEFYTKLDCKYTKFLRKYKNKLYTDSRASRYYNFTTVDKEP